MEPAEGETEGLIPSSEAPPAESPLPQPEKPQEPKVEEPAAEVLELGGQTDVSQAVQCARAVLRSSSLASTSDLLAREVLEEVIREDHERWWGCLSLPVLLIYYIFFASACIWHQDITNSYMTESPIRDYFSPQASYSYESYGTNGERILSTLSQLRDTWSFLNTMYVPFFFTRADSFGNPLSQDKLGTFYQFNQVVGTVMLEQTRSTRVVCGQSSKPTGNKTFNADAGLASHLYCYPQTTISTDPFGIPMNQLPNPPDYYMLRRRLNEKTDELPVLECEEEGFTVQGCGHAVHSRRLDYLRDELLPQMPVWANDPSQVFRFLLFPSDPMNRTMRRLQYLQDRVWLDEATNQLKMTSLALNYQLEIPRIIQTVITIYFSRGGGLQTSMLIDSLPCAATLWYRNTMVFCDIVYIGMLICATFIVAGNLLRAWRKKALASHFTGTNLLLWLTCLLGWLVSGGVAQFEMERQATYSSLQAYLANPTINNNMALLTAVGNMANYRSWLRVAMAFSQIVYMFLVFVSLQWQPRLGVVFNTLSAAVVDLFHFMLVLIPTFFGFTIAGMVMFGRRIQDFSSLTQALSMCYQIIMESQWDNLGYTAEDLWTTVTWLWLYTLLVVLIMLNMVLAIIIDIYSEITLKAGENMTLWDHAIYVLRCIRYRHKFVRYKDLMERISAMPKTVLTTELVQAFPEMHDHQLNYIIAACANKAQVINRVGINTGETAQMTAAIHLSLEEIFSDLQRMKRGGWMGRGFEVSNDKDREHVKDILTSIAVQSHWMTLTQKKLTTIGELVGKAPSERRAQRQRTTKMPSKLASAAAAAVALE